MGEDSGLTVPPPVAQPESPNDRAGRERNWLDGGATVCQRRRYWPGLDWPRLVASDTNETRRHPRDGEDRPPRLHGAISDVPVLFVDFVPRCQRIEPICRTRPSFRVVEPVARGAATPDPLLGFGYAVRDPGRPKDALAAPGRRRCLCAAWLAGYSVQHGVLTAGLFGWAEVTPIRPLF
jgi:hypothetical protein